ILDGFPARVEGRLVWVHRQNLNTDGIYGREHTYQDRTPEEMAAVVMANYDPTFAERVGEGDVLVGSWNFGTGSSREQAATALQARGIALVIAGSFSQTYLRNAFNNGLICVESPGLVRAVEAALGTDEATAIPGDELAVDFRRGAIRWRDEEYRFPALGRVPQGLVVAGGVEAQVRERLA
ncbi:MAG: homoaconitase, partial [Gemmatimonadota bacterium]